MSRLIIFLHVLAVAARANSSLQGVATVLQTSSDNLLQVRRVPVGLQGRYTDQIHHNVNNGSLQNAGSLHFNDRHNFVLNNVTFEAILTDSSVLILREDKEALQMVYHHSVPYPGKARSTYLQPDDAHSSLHVAFESTSPMRVDLSTSSFQSLQMFPSLNGRNDILPVEGIDTYEDRVVFYIYINELGHIFFQSTEGSSMFLPPDEVGSCSALNKLHPLSVSSESSTLDFIVDCTSSAGTKLRYICAYNAYEEELEQLIAINEASGTPLGSEKGDYLAVVTASEIESELHTLMVFEVGSARLAPATAVFNAAIQVRFLQLLNETWMVILTPGEDMRLLNVSLFTATQGDVSVAGQVVPDTAVRDCNPVCPPANVYVVGGKYIITTVWNQVSSLFDLLYMDLGPGSAFAPTRLPQVARQPSILSFLETDFMINPTTGIDTATTTTNSQTPQETTASPATPTASPATPTASPATPTASPATPTASPATPTGQRLVAPVVAAAAALVVMVVVGILVLCCFCNRKNRSFKNCSFKKCDPVIIAEEENAQRPIAVRDIGINNVMVVHGLNPHVQTHLQVVTEETDVGYHSSSSSRNSSCRASPVSPRVQQV